MKELIFSSPLFGVAITIISFSFWSMVQQKTKKAFLNPLLLSIATVIVFLLIFDIPYSWYNNGGTLISFFLAPATCSLALNIYRQWEIVKKNILALLVGTIVGSLASILLVILSCDILAFEEEITYSLIPKSITTPMAMAVAESLGGIPSITVIVVIITGVIGNIVAPLLIKLLKTKSPIAEGIAIGTSSHAIGTVKAIEIGEVQGALSSVALTFSGIITVLLSLIIFH